MGNIIRGNILTAIFCTCVSVAQAQSNAYRYVQQMIKGEVLNKNTRAPIPSAEVRITKKDSNIVYSVRTDEKGIFLINPKGLNSFSLEVKKFGYETYYSQVYNFNDDVGVNYNLGEIVLVPTIVFPPPKDTVQRPPQEYLEREFARLDMLPTASAYELFYALNPGLKELKLVDPEYKLVVPKIPEMPREQRRQFSDKFKDDSKEDESLQNVLSDSISFYRKIYNDFLYTVNINYEGASLDSTRSILELINKDLADYKREVRRTRKAKATELIKLINSCCIILNQSMERRTITHQDYFYLKHIGLQLSLLLPSENSRKYYTQTGAVNNALSTDRVGRGPSFSWSVNPDETIAENFFENSRALRAFNVAIYLSKNGRVVSEGDDVLKRFRVICYPPALKSIKGTWRECDSPATFAYITLSNAPYEFMVFDLRTGRQMKFVKDNADSEVISTEDAFREFAKTLMGVNQFQIPIYIKE